MTPDFRWLSKFSATNIFEEWLFWWRKTGAVKFVYKYNRNDLCDFFIQAANFALQLSCSQRLFGWRKTGALRVQVNWVGDRSHKLNSYSYHVLDHVTVSPQADLPGDEHSESFVSRKWAVIRESIHVSEQSSQREVNSFFAWTNKKSLLSPQLEPQLTFEQQQQQQQQKETPKNTKSFCHVGNKRSAKRIKEFLEEMDPSPSSLHKAHAQANLGHE